MGDEIREINGISVANQTVEQLQKMLVSTQKDHLCGNENSFLSSQLTADYSII